jgi:hypothetical protein
MKPAFDVAKFRQLVLDEVHPQVIRSVRALYLHIYCSITYIPPMYPPRRPVDNEAVCILCGEKYHHCEHYSRFSLAAAKRTRTHAVPVKGAHSGVPGLQDLVIMAYRHFGQFWNEPRPWENYRIKMSAELKRQLPRSVFYHEELGWLNHQTFYQAALEMYIQQARSDVIPNPCPQVEAKRVRDNFKHTCYRILDLVDQGHYSRLTDEQKEDRYNISHGTIVADRQAVAAGTANERQANRHAVAVRGQRSHNDLAALLRVLESLDPEEFAQVPDHLKIGLNNHRLSNLRAAGKTEDQNNARPELIAGVAYREHFAPYSDIQMDAALAPMLTRVEAILAENLGYLGMTTRSDQGFDFEVAAWVSSARAQQYAPAVTHLDGTLFQNRQALEAFGFQVEILHQHQFAYNCRVLETKIHRAFQASPNRLWRLWRKVGSGSYFLKEKDLQNQIEFSLISSVFIVFAPL